MDLYESTIQEFRDLAELQSNEGIHSVGKYVRKVADVIIERFKTIEPIFEEIYLAEYLEESLSSPVIDQLREKAQEVVSRETLRAESLTEQLCSSLTGSNPERAHAFVMRARGEGAATQQKLDASILLLADLRTKAREKENRTGGNRQRVASMPEKPIAVFISHSGEDVELAAMLLELLRAALPITTKQIRCTSVDGFRLPAGAHSETQLRAEIAASEVFIGLITSRSLASTYVLFELGARWGAEQRLIPLLSGVHPRDLRGPLTALNALDCSVDAQLYQLVANVASYLNMDLQEAAGYSTYVSKLARLSESQVLPVVGRNTASFNDSARNRESAHIISTGARILPVVQISNSLWSLRPERYVGQREMALLEMRNGIIIQFSNEAITGARNSRIAVRPLIRYEVGGQVVRRATGCWVDEDTDIADFRVDGQHSLLAGAVVGGQLQIIAKTRVTAGSHSDRILTEVERLPAFSEGNICVRLTGADSGEVLLEQKFHVTVDPIGVSAVTNKR